MWTAAHLEPRKTVKVVDNDPQESLDESQNIASKERRIFEINTMFERYQ